MKLRSRKIIKIIISIIIICTLLFLYSKYLNPIGFKVREQTIYSKDLPEKYDGLKIVHISDIHYGVTIKEKELKRIVQKINLTKPDIVFFTGDLLDKSIKYNNKDLQYLAKQLNQINSQIDKYFVSGNNDYNNKEFETVMNNSGFVNLNDTYKIIYNYNSTILIAGISTTKSNTKMDNKIATTIEYLNNNDMYSILIMHEPDNVNRIDYDKFNLILAGHSHGGQIRLPVIGGILTKNGAQKYVNDHYKINHSDLYVSNGLGNSDIKYRFLNKPSFNLFRLRSK